jgi:uncharacterized membrane protein YfcA
MSIEIIIAAFLSGLIGAMGLGGGGVLLIYLTVFANTPQLQAQGMNLLFFLPIGLLAIITYALKKQIAWKTVVKMWLGGVVGALLGHFIANLLSTDILSKIFAGFLIIFGGFSLLSKEKKRNFKKGA